MKRLLPTLTLLALAAPPVAAHPLPNLRFDRVVSVRLAPSGVAVQYTLEMNDWTMVFDGKNLVTPGESKEAGTQRGYAKVYAAKKAPLLADNLRATLDGRELHFRSDRPVELQPVQDHLRFVFHFRADWSPPPGEKHAFEFEDQNFEDRSGRLDLFVNGSGFRSLDIDDPADLRGVSPLNYKPGDERRARRASAVFDLEGEKPAAPAGEPPPAPPTPGPPAVEETGERPTLFEDVRHRGLTALFDSGLGLGVLLVLSALFGMAHAFTPGHGKTMVAAYLVGERGTPAHAVVLGLVATAAHTGSVIVLAAVVYLAYGNAPPADIQAWITVFGGLVIAGVGLWLFLQRVRGRADHVHLLADHHHDHGDGHHHHHGPSHDHHHHHPMPVEAKTGFGWARVVLLGLGGGVIPCYDAVLMFIVALNLGRVGLAVPLLVAFSAGLAAVLIALGMAVVYANRAGGRRFAERRWFRALPAVSAAVLMALGVWFVRDGWQALTAEDGRPAAVRP